MKYLTFILPAFLAFFEPALASGGYAYDVANDLAPTSTLVTKYGRSCHNQV
jgi:hypothetical protein